MLLIGTEAISWAEQEGCDLWFFDHEEPGAEARRVSLEEAVAIATRTPTLLCIDTNHPERPVTEYLRGGEGGSGS
ncbi:MAG: hypothetical protein R3E97_23210 [Candidatus Eisenbacteria bacterium]